MQATAEELRQDRRAPERLARSVQSRETKEEGYSWHRALDLGLDQTSPSRLRRWAGLHKISEVLSHVYGPIWVEKIIAARFEFLQSHTPAKLQSQL